MSVHDGVGVQACAELLAYMYSHTTGLVRNPGVSQSLCLWLTRAWIVLFIHSKLFKSQTAAVLWIKINDCVVDANVKALVWAVYWQCTAAACLIGLYFYGCVRWAANMRVFSYYRFLPSMQEAIGLLKWQQIGALRLTVWRQLCVPSSLTPCPLV